MKRIPLSRLVRETASHQSP